MHALTEAMILVHCVRDVNKATKYKAKAKAKARAVTAKTNKSI